MRRYALLSLLALGACQAAPASRALTDADRAALQDTLIQFARQMVKDIDGHDVEKFIGYHANVPGFAWQTSGAFVPLDTMHASMRVYFGGPQGQNVHFTLGDARAYVIDRDAGVVSAIIQSSNVDSTGKPRQGHQAWSIVVQRLNGDWKVVQAHESYPRTPPDTSTRRPKR